MDGDELSESDRYNEEEQALQSGQYVDLNQTYLDIWVLISRFLPEEDIIHMGCVCRMFYRLLRRNEIKAKLAFPFRLQYKLTYEQMVCVKEMLLPMNGYLPTKLVSGDVGSGKTLVALSYALRKYENKMIVISVPPANVAQWSDVIDKFVDIRQISNYSGSKYYDKGWETVIQAYRIVVSSHYTTENVLGVLARKEINPALVVDECHHWQRPPEMDLACETIGFTASIGKVSTEMWSKQFNLRSRQLRENLKPVEIKTYKPCGYSDIQRRSIKGLLNSKKTTIGSGTAHDIVRICTYGKLLDESCEFVVGRKKFKHNCAPYQMQITEEILMDMMKQNRKFYWILQLAIDIAARGEKLVIFDNRENELELVYYYLMKNGIESYLFSSAYSPKGRANNIKKFQQTGVVLLGALYSLSESHNITEANHVLFLGYPRNLDQYKQAIGRVHRYPQTKTVYVHLLVTCELEKFLALKMLTGWKFVRKDTILKYIEEFIDTKHIISTDPLLHMMTILAADSNNIPANSNNPRTNDELIS